MTIRHSILFRAISHLVNILGIFKNEDPSPPSERTSNRREFFSGSWDHMNPDSLPAEACGSHLQGSGQGMARKTPHGALPHRDLVHS